MRRRLLFLIPAAAILIPVAAVAFVFLSVSPSSVSFETRCTFSAADPKTVSITNNGGDPAQNLNVSISPSSMSSIFPIGGQIAGQQIPPGDELQFEVGFNPVHVGRSSADAVVTYTTPEPTPTDTSGGGQGGGGKPSKPPPQSSPTPTSTRIPLSGNAIDRFIDVAPLGLNFGSVHVGTKTNLPERTITIYDDGDSHLHVTGISFGGRHSGDFTVKGFKPSTVSDGHPIKFKLSFNPRAAGARAAELNIESDSCEQPTFRVQLAGIGIEPDVGVAPTPIDFGNQTVGTSTKKHILIRNRGGWPLNLKKISFESVDQATDDIASFKVLKLPVLPKRLAPAKTVSFDLFFDPSEPGARQIVMKITSNDPDHPLLRVAIDANGVVPPSPSASPTVAPPPPTKGGGFHFDIGPYIPALGVTAAVVGFFVLLVVVRRRRGIPE